MNKLHVTTTKIVFRSRKKETIIWQDSWSHTDIMTLTVLFTNGPAITRKTFMPLSINVPPLDNFSSTASTLPSDPYIEPQRKNKRKKS